MFENSANVSGDSLFTTTFQSCALFVHFESIRDYATHFIFKNFLSTRLKKFGLEEKSPIERIPGTETTLLLSATDEANT